jgi:hypothetical protein
VPGGQGAPIGDVLEAGGIPGNLMSPGASVALTVPSLKPGHYGMVCAIATEGEGVPHFAKGMLGELYVVDGQAATPNADSAYRVTPGQPIEGPAVLPPGPHTLRVDVPAGGEKFEPNLLKLAPGKSFADLDRVTSQLYEGQGPPPRGAAAQIPGELTFIGFDLDDVKTLYLVDNFSPGTYLLAVGDNDAPGAPKPPRESILIQVK